MKRDIEIKRVYDPADKNDGTRVLVDRLWPRGLSRADAKLDAWVKDIAPSAELRKWFGHDPERWAEFVPLYEAELRANKEAVRTLLELAGKKRLTLLYAAHDGDHNNAVVLSGFLKKLH